eukprot:4560723-Alexandrium_andersonii.AAC.1
MSCTAGPVEAQINHLPILPIGDNLLGDRCLVLEEVLPRADVGVLPTNMAFVSWGCLRWRGLRKAHDKSVARNFQVGIQ